MKLVGLLIWQTILLVTVQSSEIFEIYKEQYDEVGWNVARKMIGDIMSEDGQTFRPSYMRILSTIESQLCFEEHLSKDDSCDPIQNWIPGCKCKDEFAALKGDCKNAPCKILRLIKTNGPNILQGLASAESYEERFRVLMDLLEQILRILCECRGVVGAAINCIKGYSGSLLLRLLHVDFSKFEEIVNHLDWDNMGEIVHSYSDAICGQHKGEDCLDVFKTWQINVGALFDNTFNNTDTCLSLIRVEEDVEKYLKSQIYNNDMSNITVYVNGIADAHVKVEEKLRCDVDCAEDMRDAFYFSCCIKRVGETLTSEDMKEKFTKLFENVWSLNHVGTPPNLRGAVNKCFSIHRPASFCGDKTDVYKNMDQKCDAMGN